MRDSSVAVVMVIPTAIATKGGLKVVFRHDKSLVNTVYRIPLYNWSGEIEMKFYVKRRRIQVYSDLENILSTAIIIPIFSVVMVIC